MDKYKEKVLEQAIASVLVNALNYPEGVSHHVLGRDMSELIEKVTQSVIGTGLVEMEYGTMNRPEVTRIEVIDGYGRAFVKYGASGVATSLQDNGRTLKLFLQGGIDGA